VDLDAPEPLADAILALFDGRRHHPASRRLTPDGDRYRMRRTPEEEVP
jgi:hypothetical protein